MTISVEDLVTRNATFAAGGAHAGLPFPTNQILRVVGCVDSRVDPSDILGLFSNRSGRPHVAGA